MIEAIRGAAANSPDLLKREFRVPGAHPLTGHCYVASEALYHLGLKEQGYRPKFIRHEGSPHWFLQRGDDEVIDPTVEQFRTTPEYSAARGIGFLTKEPSKRARTLIERAGL